ncbi:MAG: glucose-6-phosphate isomerase [Pseudomonadota bacterium]|jgi:glucose-6-phosphate isomerase
MDTVLLWERFKGRLIHDAESGFSLDTSRLSYDDAYLSRMEPLMQSALKAMSALEQGAIANPDEGRMVGHYWLRAPELAPTSEIRDAIAATIARIKRFAADVHSGAIAPRPGVTFSHVLVVGIGGSALGPQFVNQALNSVVDPMTISFFDNTDPDGMAKTLYSLPSLERTLVVVISKSGGTKETRNGQLVVKAAFQAAGLDFPSHCVAVTGEGSELDAIAKAEGWIARFPMWDWVGGRTSECSAVGLVPFALQGFSVDEFLHGAADMDEMTRRSNTLENPAAMLALAWYHCGCGRGSKDMVVLPYKDRLELFSRYLQQLVMESLGKELDLSGSVVNQGLAVYGNKGSTDQHAYVQQLRDGLHNFFAVFIEVLKDRSPRTHANAPLAKLNAERFEVEPGATSGDYLAGFFLGTRSALFEKDRESVTVTVSEVSERTVGMLIALFERAVGLYASLINVNAYHQPGVEAGKKAAARVLALQEKVVAVVRTAGAPVGVDEIAAGVGSPDEVETVFKILRRLAVNERVMIEPGSSLFDDRYYCA